MDERWTRDGAEVAVDELSALRRRAYGPDADIAGDPQALARLAHLEGAERARFRPGAPSPREPEVHGEEGAVSDGIPGAAEHATAGGPPPTAGSADNVPDEDAPAEASVPLARRALPWWIAGVASLIAVIALSLVVGETLSRPHAEVRLVALDEPPEGTSMPTVERTWLGYWGISDPVYVYHGALGGLGVWSISEGSERDCLIATVDGAAWNIECAVPPVSPVINISTDDFLVPPDSLTPAIPEGSTVRLVLTGDTVEVFVGRLILDRADGSVPPDLRPGS